MPRMKKNRLAAVLVVGALALAVSGSAQGHSDEEPDGQPKALTPSQQQQSDKIDAVVAASPRRELPGEETLVMASGETASFTK